MEGFMSLGDSCHGGIHVIEGFKSWRDECQGGIHVMEGFSHAWKTLKTCQNFGLHVFEMFPCTNNSNKRM